MIVNVMLGAYIIYASVTDIRKSLIPNYLTVNACLAGLMLHTYLNGWDGLYQSFIGLLIGFGLMLPLYLVRAVGAGDVKLFAGIGALTGSSFVINSMIYSLLCAGLIGIAILIWRKELHHRIAAIFVKIWMFIWVRELNAIRTMHQGKNVTFPFMIAVVPGIVFTYFDKWI
ncbi:prepilin peptidase [Paenibacillus albiflavus]|uniref:Prepilin peptidase n=1 Tax=Paenibacillus albiflavus TaxID=2545760 RepID=A0A4R4EN50_9BACL|nr:prepilin peptidase [Paenibacillus albiflavus]TCZ81013.1 prepilin peptidase [Paenibacillus albiflavus]